MGMTRYDASFKGIYRGAFWSVLPASAEVNVVDHDDLHFLYRAEVRPAASSHIADNWLAVFDAAASPEGVNTVSSVLATNVDAVQFNDKNSSIVAFANLDPHLTPNATLVWPLNGASVSYIVGLTPGATYGVSSAGGNLTITSSGVYQASAAGVIVYRPCWQPAVHSFIRSRMNCLPGFGQGCSVSQCMGSESGVKAKQFRAQRKTWIR